MVDIELIRTMLGEFALQAIIAQSANKALTAENQQLKAKIAELESSAAEAASNVVEINEHR